MRPVNRVVFLACGTGLLLATILVLATILFAVIYLGHIAVQNQKQTVYVTIAEAQAEAGDVAGAKKTAELASGPFAPFICWLTRTNY